MSLTPVITHSRCFTLNVDRENWTEVAELKTGLASFPMIMTTYRDSRKVKMDYLGFYRWRKLQV